jgi:ribosome-associated protein
MKPPSVARPPPPPPTADAPSKTARKKAMHDLQSMGEALVELDPSRIAALDLPERLVDAIAQARTITKHEGRRRQMQYVGRLMRDVDPAPIAEALTALERGTSVERARFAALERWRTRVLDDTDGLADFTAAHPGADRAALAALVAEARAERVRGGPPHKYRALFRELKRIAEGGADDTATPSTPWQSS